MHALLLAAVIPALAAAAGPPLTPEAVRSLKASVVRIKGLDAVGDVRATGSGFVVDPSGVVATNKHVVDLEGAQLVVELANGSQRKVLGVLAQHDARDVALLQLEGEGYSPLPLGSSAAVAEGTLVTVIGAPLGLGWTVSAGTVSAIREHGLEEEQRSEDHARYDDPEGRLLQLDVSSAQGASGSPVVNDAGEVIGIVSSGMGTMGSLVFAVPVEAVKEALASAGQRSAAGAGSGTGQRTRWRNLGISLALFAAIAVLAFVRRKRAPAPRRR